MQYQVKNGDINYFKTIKLTAIRALNDFALASTASTPFRPPETA